MASRLPTKAWDRETGPRQTPCANDPGNIREWAGVPTHWSAASYTPQIRPPNRHQVAVDLRFLRSEVATDYAPADSLNIILKPDQNQVKAVAGRGRVGAALTRTRAGWYYVTARVDRGDFGQELYMGGMEPLRLDNEIQNSKKFNRRDCGCLLHMHLLYQRWYCTYSVDSPTLVLSRLTQWS